MPGSARRSIEPQGEGVCLAIATGCRTPRILFRHLLPNTLATILVIATLQTGGIILFVAALSFLDTDCGRQGWLLQAWWIAIAPGVAISLLIISLNLVGDWMRDTFDPRLRGR